MRKFLLQILPWLFCLTLPGFSQQSKVVRIGVAILRTSATDVSVTEARDRIVKKLNHLKSTDRGAAIQAVALDALHISDALGEAKQKNCQFVLISHLTDLLTEDKIAPSTDLHTLDRHEIAIVAKVDYEIYGVGSRKQYAAGKESGEDTTHQNAVWRVMDAIAHDVTADLSRGPMPAVAEHTAPMPSELPVSSHFTWGEPCDWIPGNLSHADALRGACMFALSLKQKMPNFICDQETARYLADETVPRDLISAQLRYQDGEESVSEVKVNGKPASETAAHSIGMWSKGEFGGDLRAIFDSENKTVFQFSGEKETGSHEAGTHEALVFRYQIAKQNDPLWVLRGRDGVLAPAYSGELWLDEKTGAVVRFHSVAEGIPLSFVMQSAELAIDYESVKFADGTEFVLPADATIATTYRGEDATRNVMKFKNCHKFRAQARMLLEASAGGQGPDETNTSPDAAKAEIEKNDEIYEILRAQAIREDDARMAAEQNHELEAAARAAMARLNDLQKQHEEELAKSEQKSEGSQTAAPVSATQDVPTIKVNVDLVPVSVVTRDQKGRAVGSLERANFSLFDERQLQMITRFSVEKNGADEVNGDRPATVGGASSRAEARAVTERYVAYVFDDLHSNLEDLEKAKNAAAKHLAELQAGERVAIFATSGKVALDFTSSQDLLQNALRELKPRSREGESCPPMNYYEADLMLNQGDPNVREMATGDAVECMFKGGASPPQVNMAAHTAWAKAMQVVANGRDESNQALRVLQEVVARISAKTGKRSIVVISPGFPTLTEESQAAAMNLIDRALRSEIVVNTLDVTGLEAGLIGESSGFASPADRIQFNTQEQMARTGVMADLAYGTGGVFFHNNNDLNDGFRHTADVPEFIYVLGFSPQKLDGKFHKLKVAVKGQQKLNVQARPGYYALKPASGS
jgi:VWFA-related protein